MGIKDHYKNLPKNSITIYCPNIGNAGDAIIALGTLSFFKTNNIKYNFYNPRLINKDSLVTFAGGGAFVGIYKRSETLLENVINKAKHVTILPHTIKAIPECIIKNYHKVTVFSREMETEKLLSIQFPARVENIDHDLAFQLRGKIRNIVQNNKFNLAGKCILYGTTKQRLRAIKNIPRAFKAFQELKASSARQPKNNILNCFRIDNESTNKKTPCPNFDISDLYKIGTETIPTIELSAKLFIDSIDLFNIIHTDRLHCAITAALLNKKVYFYPNNYFKNLKVFEYSLKNRYKNVIWMN